MSWRMDLLRHVFRFSLVVVCPGSRKSTSVGLRTLHQGQVAYYRLVSTTNVRNLNSSGLHLWVCSIYHFRVSWALNCKRQFNECSKHVRVLKVLLQYMCPMSTQLVFEPWNSRKKIRPLNAKQSGLWLLNNQPAWMGRFCTSSEVSLFKWVKMPETIFFNDEDIYSHQNARGWHVGLLASTRFHLSPARFDISCQELML